jgi:hypothetical protein
MEHLQGVRLVHVESQRGFGRREGQHLEADFCEQAQRAIGAHHQAGQVVTRHVLHDLAAKRQILGTAVEHGQSQHVVAHRAHVGARRARQACGDQAAHRATRSKPGRLKWQALVLFGKRGFQFGQWGSCSHGHHEFTGFVAGDASK